MKKNVKRVAKAKGPNTNSIIERSGNEGSDPRVFMRLHWHQKIKPPFA